MAITNFFPEVWSARLTHKLTQWSAFAQATDTSYEGDVSSYGDTVRIFTLDDNVTIKNYTRNTDIADPELLNTSEQVLTIDQQKYFNFAVDDLDRVQSRANLIDSAVDNTTRKAGLVIDNYVAGLLNSVTESTFGLDATGSSTAPTFNLNFTNDLRQFAMQQALPLSRLRVITTPNVIKQIDDGMVAGTYGELGYERVFSRGGATPDPVDNVGFVGTINGISFYVTNDTTMSVRSGSTSSQGEIAYAFDSRDLAFVSQVASIEAYRPEKRFSDAVKGVYLYAGRVLNASRMSKFRFRRVA